MLFRASATNGLSTGPRQWSRNRWNDCRASAAYTVDEEMQKLGTAAVHLLTIATSYMAAQSAETTPRDDSIG